LLQQAAPRRPAPKAEAGSGWKRLKGKARSALTGKLKPVRYA
jgi:hypothetical protein